MIRDIVKYMNDWYGYRGYKGKLLLNTATKKGILNNLEKKTYKLFLVTPEASTKIFEFEDTVHKGEESVKVINKLFDFIKDYGHI